MSLFSLLATSRHVQADKIDALIGHTSAEAIRDGGQGVAPRVRGDAIAFFQELTRSSQLLSLPEVEIGDDGSAGFLFASVNQFVYVDFTADDRIHYYVRVGTGVQVETVADRSLGYAAAALSLAPYLLPQSTRSVQVLGAVTSDTVTKISVPQNSDTLVLTFTAPDAPVAQFRIAEAQFAW